MKNKRIVELWGLYHVMYDGVRESERKRDPTRPCNPF